jgi:hypothetical protein
LELTLSTGASITIDQVVFASGYRADLARVPYLAGVLDRISATDGFPDLSEGLETSLPGLYLTGFAATRDFGPFHGFTKGCPSAARIAVTELNQPTGSVRGRSAVSGCRGEWPWTASEPRCLVQAPGLCVRGATFAEV